MKRAGTFTIRQAELADVDGIAAAHLDSIRSIGARFYDSDVVNAWSARVAGDLYANAMARGEVFFVATGKAGGNPPVLGFSSHKVHNGEHRTAVYVRGQAARRGVGSALFRRAEAAAIEGGATSIRVDASLAAVEFYEANGFETINPGTLRIGPGCSMACVLMKKTLAA